MYWKTIGTSVRTVFEHTYLYNRIWGRPIYPIGQTYEAPGNAGLRRSSAASPPATAACRRAGGTGRRRRARSGGRSAATSAMRPLAGYRQDFTQPLLKRGSKGDMVVWAQEHLISAGEEVPVTGVFGKRDDRRRSAPSRKRQGLPVDGQIGHEHLGRAAELHAVPDALGGRATASSLRRGQPRRARPPAALRLAARQGRRDRPRPPPWQELPTTIRAYARNRPVGSDARRTILVSAGPGWGSSITSSIAVGEPDLGIADAADALGRAGRDDVAGLEGHQPGEVGEQLRGR